MKNANILENTEVFNEAKSLYVLRYVKSDVGFITFKREYYRYVLFLCKDK